MEKRIAVFPGSFDPITKGHENIIRRGLPLFDEIVVGIGYNTNKNYFFSQERREHFIKKAFQDQDIQSARRLGSYSAIEGILESDLDA